MSGAQEEKLPPGTDVLERLGILDRKKLTGKFAEALRFRHTLTSESDRGCALMAAAYLDLQLYELLKAYFVEDGKVAEGLLGPSRPLESFSSRIDMAYALGLIGRKTRRELHIIRKVRNDFAHKHTHVSFHDSVISNRCRELRFHQILKAQNPRSSYTRTVMGILAGVHGELKRARHRPIGKDPVITAEATKKLEELDRILRKTLGLGPLEGAG